jgi:hypothetical protein
MRVEAFWQHWQVMEDPFRAEEARDDAVFRRLTDHETAHPDFAKVYGQPEHPAAAVVFGEKGSGKTALRIMIERRISDHNTRHPDRKAWVVSYDDLNGVLDRFAASAGHRAGDDGLLERFTLSDHQDAILSLAVTRLVTSLVESNSELGQDPVRKARRMGWARRLDLAVLAALYDQPRTGDAAARWQRLRRVLRLGLISPLAAAQWFGAAMALVTLGLVIAALATGGVDTAGGMLIAIAAAAAILPLGWWAGQYVRLWRLSRRLLASVRVVERPAVRLRSMLAHLPRRDLESHPLPLPGTGDSRYQLTARLLAVLEAFGYGGLIVLVDRLDEPVRVHGDARRMRALVWPMLDNKFLQQDRIGIKLLLPAELRHLLAREDPDFYQKARLDKQHMVDRLIWSGTTLYDLCSRRLAACRPKDAPPLTLTDLFDEDVTRQDLIDALDQMLQPRDAMKFLYRVVQEHCSNVPDEQPVFRIPRLVLQGVRKTQSDRVRELQRGLGPA